MTVNATRETTAAPAATAAASPAPTAGAGGSVASVLADTGVNELLLELDRDLIGLVPVKTRIREIAALLLIDRLRRERGFSAGGPSLHMCFSGNPGMLYCAKRITKLATPTCAPT